MKHIFARLITVVLANTLLLATTAPVFAQSMQQVPKEIQKEFQFDTHNNIGKTLPSGIKVVDSAGHSVDLLTLLQSLHAPVMLLVVRPKDCPPCATLLTYVRKHPDLNAHGKTARLVVLHIMDSKHASSGLPANVIELHTTNGLHSGFLAHYIVPETFVFNRKQVLVKRRTGVTSPEITLAYPKTTTMDQTTTYQKN